MTCKLKITANELTRPIAGIENRTAQEVFDIMCDRFRLDAKTGWELKTISVGRKSGSSHEDVWPDGDGWEIDISRGRTDGPDAGWDRFDNHEELYFRRPSPPKDAE